MSLDLVSTPEGELGKEHFVSGMVAGAMQRGFTGTVDVESGERKVRILFKGGQPIHAGSSGPDGHRLGEILVSQGKVAAAQVEPVVASQQAMHGSRPLVGAMLVKEAGVDPSDVKRAVLEQTRRRLTDAFGWSEGRFRTQTGESPWAKDVGLPLDPKALLLETLPAAMSDRERRSVSDVLLGKAVQLRDGGAGPLAQAQGAEAAKQILKYLERPRKPDQLERALGDRKLVRTILRLLVLFDRLATVPVAKAIPIPKATLLKGQTLSYGSLFDTGGPASASASAASPPRDEAPVRQAKPRIDTQVRERTKEVEKFHAQMGERNHFELLGVNDKTSKEEIKAAFKKLIMRFHSDAMGSDIPEDVAAKAREITSRLNEAHQTLTSDKARAEYEALLADDRIQGDARRAELVRDAEVKAQMGTVMLRKKDWAKARELFNYCMEADPVTAIYKAQMAYAMFSDASFDRNEVQAKGYPLLLEALKTLGEKDWRVHFWTGLFLKEQNKLKEALHHFDVAQRLDKKNADIFRERRLLKGRIEKSKDSKGGGGQGGSLFGLFKGLTEKDKGKGKGPKK